MSGKAGFTQTPWEASGSVLQRTTQHSSVDVEGDVVGEDALSRVDAGVMTAGKGIRQLEGRHGDPADL